MSTHIRVLLNFKNNLNTVKKRGHVDVIYAIHAFGSLDYAF